MNDLELVDRHGPQPLTLDDATYSHIAAAVVDGIRSGDAAGTVAGSRGDGRSVRRTVTAVAALVTAVLGVTLLSPFGGPALAIVAIDPLTFPVTATVMPTDLPLERYTFTPPVKTAMYGEDPHCDQTTCTGRRVTVVTGRSLSTWQVPDDARTVSVNGHDGFAFADRRDSEDPTLPAYSIVWTVDGMVLGVEGEGRYASRAALRSIAEGITEDPQRVDLCLTAVPEGWQLYTYLSDQYVAYGDHGQLSLALTRPNVVDLRASTEARDVRTTAVDGRPAEIGRLRDGSWILQSTTPDGQAFTLRAPDTLTHDQVERIAAGARHFEDSPRTW